MKVKFLTMTPNALDILYLAARQCYNKGFVVDYIVDDGILNSKKNSFITTEEKERLISHVVKSGHLSVLRHVNITFAIDGISRACSHQLVRHSVGIVYSQQSQRYAGKGEIEYVYPLTILKNEKAKEKFQEILENIENGYDELIALNIPAEDARFLLSNATVTRIVCTMNLNSILNFLSERLCVAAQWEIRGLAHEILKIVKEKLPIIFNNVGPKCVKLKYCPEAKNRSCGRFPQEEELNQIIDEYKRIKNEKFFM